MRIELQQLEQIDAYLTGTMNSEMKAQFESEINQSEDLRQLVENQQLLIQGIRRKALLAEINKFSSSSSGLWNFTKWFSLIVVTASIIFAGLYLISAKNENLSETQQTQKEIPVEKKITETSEENVSPATDLTAINDTECIPAKAVESVKLEKQTIHPSEPMIFNPADVTREKPASRDFDGLKTWIEPKSQYFEIAPEKGKTIECQDGTLIIVPANAFLDSKGNVIQENVTLQVVEALSVADMLAYNLTTMNNEKHLQSGGMVYLQPTVDGEKVNINPKRPLHIQIPTQRSNPEMLAWKGEVDKNGDINWTDPKPLEKFLIPVDFKLLDFLPVGFEQEVCASQLFIKSNVPSRTIADSLYYMLKDSKRKRKLYFPIMLGSGGIKKKSSKSNVYAPSIAVPSEGKKLKSSNDICMINPSSVKAIKTEPFANTFLATKEFEERIKALHQMPNPQRLLNLYCNYLTTDLYEVDSLVYSRLTSPSDQEIFRKFMEQRLTNVQNDNIHQKQLTEYYNKKREEYEKELNTFLNQRDRNDREELARLNEELNFLEGNRSIPMRSKSNYRRIEPNLSNTDSYSVTWYQTGWVNIDAYLHLLEKGTKDVVILAGDNTPDTKIYQSLNTIQTIIPLSLNDGKATAKFPKEGTEAMNAMSNAYSIGISRQDGKLMYAEQKYNPYEEKEIELTWIELSEDQLYAKLQSLPDADQQTIKGLKRTISIVEMEKNKKITELQMIMEEKKAMQELMSRLLKIAQSCGFAKDDASVVDQKPVKSMK